MSSSSSNCCRVKSSVSSKFSTGDVCANPMRQNMVLSRVSGTADCAGRVLRHTLGGGFGSAGGAAAASGRAARCFPASQRNSRAAPRRAAAAVYRSTHGATAAFRPRPALRHEGALQRQKGPVALAALRCCTRAHGSAKGSAPVWKRPARASSQLCGQTRQAALAAQRPLRVPCHPPSSPRPRRASRW